jgi:hypothetical protein
MRALALTLALALCAPPLAAETRQHGNVLFDIPQGFGYGTIGPTGTLSIWAPHDLHECPGCALRIGAGAEAGGPVEDFLAANTRRLIDPWDSPAIAPSGGIGSYLLQGRYPAAYQQQWIDDRFQILFAIQVGDRMELVAFEAPGADPDTLARAMETYNTRITAFVDGLRFVSDGADPLLPPAEPGGLNGVWWRAQYWSTSTWNYFTGTMTVTEHSDHDWLTFWPDGRFYDGTPPDGTAPFDAAARLARADMNWGTYRQSGAEVTLTYAHGGVKSYRLEGAALVDADGVALHPVQLYADGVSVEGRVDSFSHVEFTAVAGLTGGTARASEAIFRADGTWSGTSASATGGLLDGGAIAGGESGTVTGRYEVRNGILWTHDEAGQLYGANYLFMDKDGTIWVGEETLD